MKIYHHSAVPNKNILGYIKIDDAHEGKSSSFFPNPQYKPVVNELGAIKRSVRRELHVSQKKEPQIDAPKKKKNHQWMFGEYLGKALSFSSIAASKRELCFYP